MMLPIVITRAGWKAAYLDPILSCYLGVIILVTLDAESLAKCIPFENILLRDDSHFLLLGSLYPL